MVGGRSEVACIADLDEVLARDDVDAVAARPCADAPAIALAALRAGKHVLVEKPLGRPARRRRTMVRSAADSGLVLMADHTYCYTPAVRKIRELVGRVLSARSCSSTRCGSTSGWSNRMWTCSGTWRRTTCRSSTSSCPGPAPRRCLGAGRRPARAGKACIGYLTLPLPGGAIAHVHVNWLSPTKIRQMVVAGTERTLVWDDLNPQQRISVYDRGVDLTVRPRHPTAVRRPSPTVSATPGRRHCPSARRSARWSRSSPTASGSPGSSVTDGQAGLRVLSVLTAASASLAGDGRLVELPADLALERVS